MPQETIGDVEQVVTANHPPRTNSPEYNKTHEWLMTKTAGGCYVCGGPVDLSHPDAPAAYKGLLQDHHGGALHLYLDGGGDPILVGMNLFGTEWSLGWGADPARVAAFVAQLNVVTEKLGGKPYTAEIATTADVMAFVDSPSNANFKLCSVHHIAHEDKHTPDSNGHEGVGVHSGPFPIWLGQATCLWSSWDMWGGSTGTLAVGHPGDASGTAVVLNVSPLHPDQALYHQFRDTATTNKPLILPSHHANARLAYAGAVKDLTQSN